MSVIASNWARVQILHKTPKAILMHIATFANQRDGYYCFPGQKSVAGATGFSERTVRTVLAYLEDMRFIERSQRRRRDGYRSSDTITLCVDDMPIKVSKEYIEWCRGQRSHRQPSQPHRQQNTTSPATVAGPIREGDKEVDQGRNTPTQHSSKSALETRTFSDHVMAVAIRNMIVALPGLGDDEFFQQYAKFLGQEDFGKNVDPEGTDELPFAYEQLALAMNEEATRRFGVSSGGTK